MTFFDLPASLDWPAQFCAATMFVTWIASLITGNVSQVDRLWTFLPTIYSAYYALLPMLPNEQSSFLVPYAPKSLGWANVATYSPRATLMFGLIFIWMCRLSYNTYRRGLFNLSDEDYRWAVLRAQLHPVIFQILNLGFIVIVQNLLLLWLGLPTRTAALLQPHTELSTSDYALGGLALVILALEFTADNQQYAFHAYKHAQQAKESGKSAPAYNPDEHWPGARLDWTPDDAKRGFVSRGLWRYSRHPNFACEQSFWWVITLFPLMAPYPPNLPQWGEELPPLRTVLISFANPDLWKPLAQTLAPVVVPAFWDLLPGIGLSALFYFSSLFSESISEKKYPTTYRAYQKRVARFAPSHTLFKWAQLQVLGSGKENQEIEQLVFGSVDDVKKSH